jgi:hypothetical protein
MKIRLYIVVALLVLAASCRGPRTIPRDDLADIFHDMFLQDQQIRNNPSVKKLADTSLVYEGIFQEYGYTTDDYVHTVGKYIREPDKFAKIFEKAAARLEKEAKEIGKEVEFETWRNNMMKIYKQKIDTTRLPRVPLGAVDTAFFRLSDDEVKYFPPPDTLSPVLDTLVLRVPADTVALDTLVKVQIDSL